MCDVHPLSTQVPLGMLWQGWWLLWCFYLQIENLQEQLRDKDKQLTNLKDRVKSLQTDSSNTDTALATLEEALSEKVMFSHEKLRCCSFGWSVCRKCPSKLAWQLSKGYGPFKGSRWPCSGRMNMEWLPGDALTQDLEGKEWCPLNAHWENGPGHGKILP